MTLTCSDVNDVNLNTSGYNMIKKDREEKKVSEVGLYREDTITLA